MCCRRPLAMILPGATATKPRLMEILPHLGEAQHRRTDAARRHVERDEFADGQIPADDKAGTETEIAAMISLLTY